MAKDAKRQEHMRTLDLPPYSPDLQPLDFSIWNQIEQKARDAVGDADVTAAQYRAILRRAALRLSPAVVAKAVDDMPRRVQAIVAARGGHIQDD